GRGDGAVVAEASGLDLRPVLGVGACEGVRGELPGHHLAIRSDPVEAVRVDEVDARSAADRVAGAVPLRRHAVAARPSPEGVAARTPVEQVTAAEPEDRVVATPAEDPVGGGPAPP